MEKEKKTRRTLKGRVVSHTGDKTAVVRVERFVKHPRYKKYVRQSKKYKAHDPDNAHTVGDEVTIEESRPFSKDKAFRII